MHGGCTMSLKRVASLIATICEKAMTHAQRHPEGRCPSGQRTVLTGSLGMNLLRFTLKKAFTLRTWACSVKRRLENAR